MSQLAQCDGHKYTALILAEGYAFDFLVTKCSSHKYAAVILAEGDKFLVSKGSSHKQGLFQGAGGGGGAGGAFAPPMKVFAPHQELVEFTY